MSAPRIFTVSIIAIGILGGTAMGVVAQDQGSTQASPGSSAAPASSSDVEPAGSSSIGEPPGDARAIELTVDDYVTIRDAQTGAKVSDIQVTPGETVVLRVDNVGSISHNLYIGTDEELKPQPVAEYEGGASGVEAPYSITDVGIAEWSEGAQELIWIVPQDITDLKFGCTIHAHYFTMQGTFSVAP
jgi:uncharacterized cupredoxin-like copper-binding protein